MPISTIKKKALWMFSILAFSIIVIFLLFLGLVAVLTQVKKPEVAEKFKQNNLHHHYFKEHPPYRQIDTNGYLYADSARSNYHTQDLDKLLDYPKTLLSFVLLSENESFYSDDSTVNMAIKTIGRSLKSGGKEGGSTIYQQTARTILNLGSNKSLLGQAWRKTEELAVAQNTIEEFKKKYPNDYKDRILLLYMNQVELGINTFGFQDAARVYFGTRDIRTLTIGQQATLVAMLSQPNAYTRKDPKTRVAAIKYLKKIRNKLLDKAVDRKYISRSLARQAKLEKIVFAPQRRGREKNFHFTQLVQAELKKLTKVVPAIQALSGRGGIATRTTLDSKSQYLAEEILRKNIATYGKYGVEDGAIIVMDIDTGKIRAMVGSNDRTTQFNNAINAYRQPGSIFKLFTYLAALEKGILPTATFSCDPSQWGNRKLDACNSFNRPIDLYDAVAYSENAIAWRVAQTVGIQKVIDTAHRLGISSKLEPDYGTAIGQNTTQATLLEMIRAYGTVANNGVMPEIQVIDSIFDTATCDDEGLHRDCREIYDHNRHKAGGKQILDPTVANTMDSMLWGVVHKPGATGGIANLGLKDEAGKTGTNGVDNNSRDLWYIGYSKSQNTIAAVWLGSKGKSIRSIELSKAVGGHLAAKVWKEVMQSTIATRKARLSK